jgi:hypothetical protein
MEVRKMLENKPLEVPIISLLRTGGLTSIQQLIDNTSNEIFSFGDSTSEIEIIPIIYPFVEWVEEFNENVNRVSLGGVWKGVKITDEDIKQIRGDLLKKLEEKW